MGSKTAARARRRAPACRSCPARDEPLGPDAPDAVIAATARTDRLSACWSRPSPAAAARACASSRGPTSSPAPMRAARSEASTAVRRPGVYVERRLERPRHVEVQVLGDHARHGGALRRARVLDAAAAPEGYRGVAVAGGVASAARGARAAAAAVARRRRLHQRRHGRVPARRGRPVLLPRDEHAAAGRASGDRDGDRHRPGALADPHRARRAARPRPRRAARPRVATPSSAASTPRIPTPASALAGTHHEPAGRRTGPGSATTAASTRAARSRCSTTR